MNDQEKFQAAGDALLLMLDELGVERTSAICQEILDNGAKKFEQDIRAGKKVFDY